MKLRLVGLLLAIGAAGSITIPFAVGGSTRYAPIFCGGCDAHATENETVPSFGSDGVGGIHGPFATV